jgi:cell division protein FtsL
MTLEILAKTWPVLLLLVYVLLTCVLLVLAAHQKRTLSLHDHIRESKALRQRYLNALESKKASH